MPNEVLGVWKEMTNASVELGIVPVTRIHVE